MNNHRELAPTVIARRHRKLAALVLLGVLPCIALMNHVGVASAQTSTVPTQSALSNAGLRTITAVGAGLVNAVPDRLYLNIGVQTSSARVSDALKANNTSAQPLIAALKSKGIDVKDIKTSQVSINPQFDTTGRRVTSYNVSNAVTVTIRKIETSGDLIDAAANISGDIRF